MADIFVSYSSADRPYAQAIASALEHQGWLVWWDRKIDIGDAFDEELEQQLAEARCVVVLWSRNSVRSKWVRDEAAEGLTKNALFPAMLEEVPLPFGYRRVQTADLRGWEPDQPNPEFEKLVDALRQKLTGPEIAQATANAIQFVRPSRVVHHWRRQPWFRILVPGLPAVLLGLSALVLMQIRPALRIQLDTQVQRIRWLVGGEREVSALGSLSFSSVNIENFQTVSFVPKVLTISDQAPQDRRGREFTQAQKRTGVIPDRALFAAGDNSLHPALRIASGVPTRSPIGTLNVLRTQPGTWITVARRGRLKVVEVSLEDAPFSSVATVAGPFQMHARYAPLRGSETVSTAEDQWIEAQTRDDDPNIRIEGSQQGLTLIFGLPGDGSIDLLPGYGIPVSEIELNEMSSDGEWASSLAKEGFLSYPDYPAIGTVRLETSDLVGLHELKDFFISRLLLDPDIEGLSVRLEGQAGKIPIKSPGITIDARPTLLETLRAAWYLGFTSLSAVGIVSAALSLYQGYRELRG